MVLVALAILYAASAAKQHVNASNTVEAMFKGVDDEYLKDTTSPQALKEKLSQSSFSAFLNFIGSFSIIISHLGSILAQTGYVDPLTFILIQVLYLTKLFIKHLKLSIVENNADPL